MGCAPRHYVTADDMLALALAQAKANRISSGNPTEMERILALPRRDLTTLKVGNGAHDMPEMERREDGTWVATGNLLKVNELQLKWTRKLRRHAKAPPLREVQAEILEEAYLQFQRDEPVGIIGNVGVGKGKTLAFFLLCAVHEMVHGKGVVVLFLPPTMREQYECDLWEWQQYYKFTPPHVIYYSQLSRPEATALLTTIMPVLILSDETHALRHGSAARTKRFLRYMAKHQDTRFCGMSGTLTGSTLSDYDHLCKLALREGSPLPLNEKIVDMWGSVLNAEGEPDDNAWDALRPLNTQAADEHDVRALRQSFQLHFKNTPGVVCTSTSSCDAVLRLTAIRPALSEDIRVALANLRDDYILPDGSEVVDALHFYRASQQLSCGFYYVWDWPAEPDEEWLESRRAWGSWCRSYLTYASREGCDSPFLVEEHLRQSGWPAEGVGFLRDWDNQRHKDPPPTKPVWVDPSPVVVAYQWALERQLAGGKAFVWFRSRAVGELLQAFGMDVFWEGTPTPRGNPVCALSMQVYHKGRNFQAWNDQLIMQMPSNAATMEQLLGRSHRQGQQADVVRCTIMQQAWPLRRAWAKALTRARYIQDQTGQEQKVLAAIKEGFDE